MSKTQSRLAEQFEKANTPLPNTPVDLGDIEPGTDGALVDLITDANDESVVRGHALEDTEQLMAVGRNLQESAYLAMESINAETGLQSQTLMAMEYGVNQQLAMMGTSLTFPSLESADITEFEKTCYSLEALSDTIEKIWAAAANAAKRAGEATRTFMARTFDIQVRVIDKVTKLKQQLQSIQSGTTGNLSTTAAKRLTLGGTSFNEFVPTMLQVLKTMETYADQYTQAGLADIKSAASALGATDGNGVPTIDAAAIQGMLDNEVSRRRTLLGLGTGVAPKRDTNNKAAVPTVTDYSKLLPGGFRFSSVTPTPTTSVDGAGKIIDALPDCVFDLVGVKEVSSPKEIPILSPTEAIQLCDGILGYCQHMNASVAASEEAFDAFTNQRQTDYRKLEKALVDATPLTAAQMRRLEESSDFKEAVGKGVTDGLNLLLTGATCVAVVTSIGALAAGEAVGTVLVVSLTAGGGVVSAWLVPAVVGCALVGMLSAYFGKRGTDAVIKSSDPNAPVLHILRALSSASLMLPVYATSGPTTVMDYFSKIAGPLLDYISDSAKAHVKAGQSPATTDAVAA